MALQDYDRKRLLGRPAAAAPSEVWYALDPNDRPVVVKLLKSKLRADVERFSHEAHCAEKLVSQNVAQVWESGMKPTPYIVFEYIDGRDLTEVAPIRNLWEYLRTAEAVAAGLAAIHEQGIAHRDIKPDNVRYERDGHAKIVDLGIALTNKDVNDRQTVVPPGTEGWMAPERQDQLLELVAEQKADVFSAGLLLFYMRTGAHPFEYDQRRIQNPDDQPDLTQLDAYLREVLGKTLERDPALRPDARELLRELRRLARHIPASPRRRIGRALEYTRALTRSYRRSITMVGVSVLAALVILLTYALVPVRPDPSPAAEPPETQLCPIGQYPPNSGDAVLRFGALLPISGPLAAQGPQLSAAVDLALKDVRSVQGVPGIQIVPLDGINKADEGDPVLNTACESTNTLLMNRVDVIIGPASSAAAKKVIDRVTTAGTVLFSPSNTAPEFTDYDDKGLYFRTSASDALQGRVLGKIVAEEGNESALIISRDDSYGNGLSETVGRSLKLANVDLLQGVQYDPRTKDFRPLADRVASQHPDALVLIGFDESARILAELRNAGITPQNKKIYGTEGNMKETLPGQVAPPRQDLLSGMRGTTLSRADTDFAKRLNQSAGGGLVEFSFAGEVYDAVIVSALAAASAHSDSPEKIAEKINEVTEGGEKCTDYASCVEKIKQGVADIDYDGVSGLLEFNDTGEPCKASYSVVEFNRSGGLDFLRTADASNLCVQLR